MNKKYCVSLFVVFGFLVAASALAQSVDLGVSDPGILPTSRLYFLKEIGWGVRLFFTFDSVKKADLQADITNKKAAELQEVEETAPQNKAAIKRAVGNYQKASERLKARLEALKGTSQNPNIDKLLDKLADRTVKHEKLFDELEKKIDNKEVKELIKETKEKVEEVVHKAAEKDDPAKFVARLEKVFVESKGGDLKHLGSVEILDRISEKAPGKIKKELEDLRQDFIDRLKKDFEEFTKKVDEKTFQDTVGDLPGDVARRAVIIEEVKRKTEGRVLDALNKIENILENDLKGRDNVKEKALEQINKAEEKTTKLNKKIAEAKEIPDSVKKSLSEAEAHLKDAKAAYESGKFGDAFGQARSTEVLARNGLRMLEDADEDVDDLKEMLRAKPVDSVKRGDVACTQEFKPVCGTDGKTYSNACHAKIAGVFVKHEGECERVERPTTRSGRIEPIPEVIIIDESGNFSPQEVKVRKGGKVTWVNKGQRQAWPASDFHPTHQAYPGFDASRGLAAGESYSFTFDKAGSWGYHNHLNPGVRGAVNVVE